MLGTQQTAGRIKVIIVTTAAVALAAVVFQWTVIASGAKQRQLSLYANVEKDGNLVTGLRESNFRLYEDQQARPFRLEPPEAPASIALLLEYGSDYGLFRSDLDAIMQAFMDKAPDGSWYSLATFSHDLKIQVDFTKEKARLTDTYAQLGLPEWNESDTFDALDTMLDKMSRLPGRRVLIFAGSGIDSSADTRSTTWRRRWSRPTSRSIRLAWARCCAANTNPTSDRKHVSACCRQRGS